VSRYGYLDLAQLLIDRDTDINAQGAAVSVSDKEGDTSFHKAVCAKTPPLCPCLLAHTSPLPHCNSCLRQCLLAHTSSLPPTPTHSGRCSSRRRIAASLQRPACDCLPAPARSGTALVAVSPHRHSCPLLLYGL
jgi:hypothetical protein